MVFDITHADPQREFTCGMAALIEMDQPSPAQKRESVTTTLVRDTCLSARVAKALPSMGWKGLGMMYKTSANSSISWWSALSDGGMEVPYPTEVFLRLRIPPFRLGCHQARNFAPSASINNFLYENARPQ